MSVPVGGAAPGLRRRLACFVYEGVLLFGVVMIAGYLYSSLTQQRHALHGQTGLRVFLFLVLGLYFVWFWSHNGQTLAMKTWQIRVVRHDGHALSPSRAAVRYVTSWIWFLPALWAVYVSGSRSSATIFGSLLAGVLAYAGLSFTNPSRQYLHDLVSGTKLITTTR